MTVATLMATPLAPVAPAMAMQGAVSVVHAPVTCMIADEVPQLAASLAAGAPAGRGRAYFHSALGTEFFYVEGESAGGRSVFNLPRPRLEAGPITYYIEFQPGGRTGDYAAKVVRKASDCDDRPLAAIGPAPGTVFGPGGLVASPVGFGAAGTAVSAATAGGSLAAAGGGISTGLLIAGGALVAGAIVTVVVLSGDDTPASPSR